MKKILSLLCVGLLLMGCAKSAKQSAAEGAGGLQGKYEIDFSPLMSEITGDSEEDQMAVAIASMILAQMHMTMEFEGNQLSIDASGAVRNLVNAFGDAKMPYTVSYEVRNDSVLFIKEEKDEDFKLFGVLRYPSDSSDELYIVTKEDDKELPLLMKKQK